MHRIASASRSSLLRASSSLERMVVNQLGVSQPVRFSSTHHGEALPGPSASRPADVQEHHPSTSEPPLHQDPLFRALRNISPSILLGTRDSIVPQRVFPVHMNDADVGVYTASDRAATAPPTIQIVGDSTGFAGVAAPEAHTPQEQPQVEPEQTDDINMKPKEIVRELDRFIVGQSAAKRSVSIAMRNRWRRHHLPKNIAHDVMPKNILMIGPTGVGKTEIARRLAKLTNAPFIKVEATKFTEVGFHGRDVDMIIRDLVAIAINQTKTAKKKKLKKQLQLAVEDAILRALIGPQAHSSSYQTFREQLRSGLLEKNLIEIEVPPKEDIPQSQMADVVFNIKQLVGGRRLERRRVTIEEARPLLEEAETDKLISQEEITREAIKSVEQDGIVFLDEIDKIVSKGGERSTDASAEGVQRDLLPLIEGCTINTKFGNVETDHILFIASGAFHAVKPSDMLAELQGRLPIRVELRALSEGDLFRILVEPENNLIFQQKQLLKTEGVDLVFTDDAIKQIARMAADVNHSIENIGARRLHTVIERIVEDVSFNAPDLTGQTVVIDAQKVKEKVGDLLLKTDLSKYVL